MLIRFGGRRERKKERKEALESRKASKEMQESWGLSQKRSDGVEADEETRKKTGKMSCKGTTECKVKRAQGRSTTCQGRLESVFA